jgi:XTP/dITP diphosphohydrolase
LIEANEKTTYFEGIVNGSIAEESTGENGFGYDPIFIPEGHTKTFGELSAVVKKALSHRAKATEKLIQYLGAKE